MSATTITTLTVGQGGAATSEQMTSQTAQPTLGPRRKVSGMSTGASSFHQLFVTIFRQFAVHQFGHVSKDGQEAGEH
jgi:hypothetical protein